MIRPLGWCLLMMFMIAGCGNDGTDSAPDYSKQNK